MKILRRCFKVRLLYYMFLLSIATSGFSAEYMSPSEVVESEKKRIKATQTIRKEIDSFLARADFHGLEAHVSKNHNQWKEKLNIGFGISAYRQIMEDLIDIEEKQKNSSSWPGLLYAEFGLEFKEELPVEDYVKLIESISISAWSLPTHVVKEYRSQVATLWLQAWQYLASYQHECRINKAYDPDWRLHTGLAYLPSGASPEGLHDPAAREEGNRQWWFERQLYDCERERGGGAAKRVKPWFFKRSKWRIINLYAHPPYAINELTDLLSKYVVEEEAKQEIIKQVIADWTNPPPWRREERKLKLKELTGD